MLQYNAPIDGTKSVIDEHSNSDQLRVYKWLRKAIIDARKKQFFLPLASVTDMPKHYGKTIKVYQYIPLLDDRNINDEGINAAGVTIADGNLYGSSKDIGFINSRLPTLTENGGRVNRVGFSRVVREGTFNKFGFFYEWTKEAMDFDSDEELGSHLAREMMNGAHEITEDVLQMDLLSSAGTVLYGGTATSNATITGEGANPSTVSYKNLMRLDAILTENRTPKNTRIVTGSLKTDTRVLPSCRIAYVGPELVPLLRQMTDLFGNPAFIPVQHYADATNILNGEIGSIDSFRFIEVPEMLHWGAEGGAATAANPGYRTTMDSANNERYDIYPILVVGDDSFTTIGFQTDGKVFKFNILTKMPGKETASREHDPYGEMGFTSIKWYYGILIKRPERIGLIKTVAPL